METGLARTELGQLLISATFVTDLGTVLALSVLFVTPTWWLVPFVAVSLALIALMRGLEAWFFTRYGDRVIEPELKGAFAALLVLMWLAEKAHAEAVLPAFILGFALAPTFARHRKLQSRFRVVSFALLTPFFFLRAGLNVSLGLVAANFGLLLVLLAAKLGAKTVAVYPLARRYAAGSAWPVALLMSTGLTFGTIASQAGLSLGVITRAQFSMLVCVVVPSAVVPTALAQALLRRQPVSDMTPASGPTGDGYSPGLGDDDELPEHRPPREVPAAPLAGPVDTNAHPNGARSTPEAHTDLDRNRSQLTVTTSGAMNCTPTMRLPGTRGDGEPGIISTFRPASWRAPSRC